MNISANVGFTDKIVRMLAALILLVYSFTQLGGMSSLAGIVAIVVAAILIATALTNFCPLYKLLGLKSLPKK